MLSEGLTPDEERAMSDHFNYLKDLMEKGDVVLAGRTQNKDYSGFVIVIINASSDGDARRIMQDDPSVRAQVVRAQLYPYKIALLREENAWSPF
jgi:uncharacterized protein